MTSRKTAPQLERWMVIGLALVVCGGYVALRLAMNREYGPANWRLLVALDAPLPFGHRVLLPWMARPLVAAGLPIRNVFAAFEFAAVAALLAGAIRTLGTRMDGRWAALLGGALVFVLPLGFLLAHRWPIFYPWDTPAMAFIVWGLDAALRGAPMRCLALTALGALNRESALAIPLAYILLNLEEGDLRRHMAWAGLMFIGFVATRQGIAMALPNNPGPALHFTVDGQYRLFNNLQWLLSYDHGLRFVASLGFLPALWVVWWKFIPKRLRRLHLLLVLLVVFLLAVGNAYEPRAFGEVIVIGWIGLAFGMSAWLQRQGQEQVDSPRPRWLRSLDRYGAIALVLGFAGFAWSLAAWGYLPVSQWPMPR